ncbi:ornithine cyclodeaminase family protein [Labrys neptuniae]|uniref:ornithine cyclodeaminase family protein n=1 Tax=Labrys neptuniae TaxID=376174 RepID=UPI0028905096|nr:ornithine cyclodeaminase family protein [Labrys neptuniae]MDT3379892.1 ornithine cyclodeaminase family protein [Labrys neptuniae]
MRVITADEIDGLLSFPDLIEALRAAFAADFVTPPRQHFEIGHGADAATALIMPSWSGNAPGPGAYLGTKLVNVFPANGARGLPAVLGTYVLMSGETGAPLAAMDGTRLTHWRTAAASGLAASYLARPEASRLAMVGAGALAPFLIRAHASQRPIGDVAIWNHRAERAEKLAEDLAQQGIAARYEPDLERAVRMADVVSCATLSNLPLVKGAWLRPGMHLDLVGAFNLQMREADDEAVRTSDLFIDTPSALTEGGDIALALRTGIIGRDDIQATLADLARGNHRGRASGESLTLFKSIGSALEDLAAAILVWRKTGGEG